MTENVVSIVDSLLHHAIEKRATDVHLEPRRDELTIRMRVDGVLLPFHTLPKNLQPAIISRIKIIAGMDIAESRLPQDGRIDFRHNDDTLQLRISTLPTLHGEKIAIRILHRAKNVYRLEELGMTVKQMAATRQILEEPQGLLLLVGPTGCGKTTTLFACLAELAERPVNISSIEDPIEYTLSEVNQTQIHPKIGLTFAQGLRAMLRQDPDVIVIGEIRDSETAEIALQSASTGHLVITTLHTENAKTAETRLHQLGISHEHREATRASIISQRLLRTLCPKCNGSHCENCQETGFQGRTGIYEINSKMVESAEDLWEEAEKRVKEGKTTIEEIYRVLGRFHISSENIRDARPTTR